MRTIGSQTRDKLEDTEYEFIQWQDMSRSVLLKNTATGNYEQWDRNDDFAGYVIEINGIGFEFVTTVN